MAAGCSDPRDERLFNPRGKSLLKRDLDPSSFFVFSLFLLIAVRGIEWTRMRKHRLSSQHPYQPNHPRAIPEKQDPEIPSSLSRSRPRGRGRSSAGCKPRESQYFGISPRDEFCSANWNVCRLTSMGREFSPGKHRNKFCIILHDVLVWGAYVVKGKTPTNSTAFTCRTVQKVPIAYLILTCSCLLRSASDGTLYRHFVSG